MSTNAKRAAHGEAAQVGALGPEGEVGVSFGLRSRRFRTISLTIDYPQEAR